jgi:outer membrane protein OmpA-like peptidoglycan-associated protein
MSELNALRKSMEDDDNDGVINSLDEEPNTPEGSVVNNKGVAIASSSTKSVDSDGDGFLDENDICPNLAGTAYGCPDADKDGVPDFMDACPNEAGSLKFNGCKENDFGTRGGSNGGSKSSLLEENGVYDVLFEFDKSDLLPSGKAILDRLVKLMKDNKDLKIVVSGHADKIGAKDYNEGLSRRRAENCVKYLTSQGIDAQRLIIEFFGSDIEKYSADNKQLNLANRRVSFSVK